MTKGKPEAMHLIGKAITEIQQELRLINEKLEDLANAVIVLNERTEELKRKTSQ